jgi:MFS family permease
MMGFIINIFTIYVLNICVILRYIRVVADFVIFHLSFFGLPMPPAMPTPLPRQRSAFSRAFYVANSMEIFERLAWYGFFSLSSLYMSSPASQGGLGFSDQERGFLQGMIPFLLYLLPVLTGALADRYGYRRMFLLAFAIMCPAYYLLGRMHSFWPFCGVFFMVACGAACFKPVVVGTIGRSTNDSNRGLGFGVFYMMVNIGGFLGPLVAGYVRAVSWGQVFVMSSIWIGINFIPALFFYKEPKPLAQPDQRGLMLVLRDVREVMGNRPFVTYLLIMAGFWTIYMQVFITLPLYIRDFVDTGDLVQAIRQYAPSLLDFLAAVNVEQLASKLASMAQNLTPMTDAAQLHQLGLELVNYKVMVPPDALQSGLLELQQGHVKAAQLAQSWAASYRQINPEYIVNLDFAAIVLLQIVISNLAARWQALPVVVAGTLAISIALALCGLGHAVTLGGFSVAAAVIVFALGEMIASPKSQEYVAAIAPSNKTAMFMGYYFVSMAVGNLFGGLLSGWAYGTLARARQQPMLMWLLFAAIGAITAIALLRFNRQRAMQANAAETDIMGATHCG